MLHGSSSGWRKDRGTGKDSFSVRDCVAVAVSQSPTSLAFVPALPDSFSLRSQHSCESCERRRREGGNEGKGRERDGTGTSYSRKAGVSSRSLADASCSAAYASASASALPPRARRHRGPSGPQRALAPGAPRVTTTRAVQR